MEVAEELKSMVQHQGSDQQATARTIQRPRLLYSCGVSILTVAHKTYHRVADLSGPMGILAKTLASWASPIVHPLELRWLSLLSFADGYILAPLEDAIACVFPPSAHLFDVLDELAILSEALPKKFDDAADHLPAMIHRTPILCWVSTKVGGRLKFSASAPDDGPAGEEREIPVDAACSENPDTVASVEEDSDGLPAEGKERVLELDSCEPIDVEEYLKQDVQRVQCIENVVREAQGDAWKESTDEHKVDMGGPVEKDVAEEEVGKENEGMATAKARKEEKEEESPQPAQRQVPTKVPILELFDEGWHSTPGRIRGRRDAH